MKKIISILLFACAGALAACDFLDVVPEGQATQEDIFKTSKEARKYLNMDLEQRGRNTKAVPAHRNRLPDSSHALSANPQIMASVWRTSFRTHHRACDADHLRCGPPWCGSCLQGRFVSDAE